VAKQGGLGDAFYYSGYDMSGDVQSLGNVGGGPGLLEFTDITQAAMARQGGIRDGRIEWVSFFNPGVAANAAHGLLSVLPRGDVLLTYCRGTTLGAPAACLNGKQVNYDGTRGQDGSFTFAVSAQANSYGLEWGVLATAGIRTDVAGANGTALDNAASTAFGLQAYLQVFAVTGTSVTVKLQDSPDNSVWTDVVGGAFTAATVPGAQRIATSNAQTVARYLRVVTSGTFTNAQLAVVVCRNSIAGVTF
jgi:hypothetical protein